MIQYIPIAEILSGIACLVLAYALFFPLKRFASAHTTGSTSTLNVTDEMLAIGLIVIGITGIGLIAAGFNL
jgi:hypothetical protein